MDVNLPRFPLATLPTPLAPARTLPILIKRDDLAGFAAAGHKARQLEFLVGAARADGSDVLVTGGGPGSNFCPAAAVAAAVAGLDCEILLYGPRPERTHPNLAAALAAGAHVQFTGDRDRAALDDAVLDLSAKLQASGRRPYAIPRGGATPVGAVGMAVAAAELQDIEFGAVVVAVGSGGACAGLAVGAPGWRVVGASVSRPLDEASAQVDRLAAECAALLQVPAPGPVELVDVRGPGFGVPSEEGEEAARIALQQEGLLLDPVYTAKAFAAVLRLIDEGVAGPIVFWHTGGLLSAADHLAHQR